MFAIVELFASQTFAHIEKGVAHRGERRGERGRIHLGNISINGNIGRRQGRVRDDLIGILAFGTGLRIVAAARSGSACSASLVGGWVGVAISVDSNSRRRAHRIAARSGVCTGVCTGCSQRKREAGMILDYQSLLRDRERMNALLDSMAAFLASMLAIRNFEVAKPKLPLGVAM